MKRIRQLVLILLSFFLPALPCAASEAEPVTLMIYMCGSNLESRNCAGSQDLMEIMKSGYDEENVHVLIMTGGTKRWGLNLPNDALCVYTPQKGKLQMLEAFEQADMGSADTFSSFLQYCYSLYPDGKHALIMWDHGGGPLSGVCMDELYGFDALTMEELCGALQAGPISENRLDWIGFDACLMASAEVAYLLAPYAKYMIASEETEPGGGWDYSFLKGLEADADAPAAALRVMDGYFAASKDTSQLTLSCIDLDRIESLGSKMDPFFDSLSISGGNYALFSFAAANTRAFGRAADASDCFDLIDLGALVDMLKAQSPEAGEAVLQAMSDAVVCSKSGSESGGLSVYHPYENKNDYLSEWYSIYPSLGFSEGYTDYIARFAGYLFGESDVAWDGLSASPTDESSIYALPLSEGQQALVASADMHVLQWDAEKETYAAVGGINRLAMEEGVLYGAWSGQILTAVDEDGEPLTDAIPYDVSPDGTFTVMANYCMEDMGDLPEASVLVSGSGSTLQRDFGSYSFDTVEPGSSSLSDDLQNTPLHAETLSPASSAAAQALAVPASSSLRDTLEISGASPVSSTGWTAWSASSGSGGSSSSATVITPVTDSLFHPAVSEGESSTVGSNVDTNSLTPVGTASFSQDQVTVTADSYQPPSPEAAGQPQVLHAQLTCRADEDGSISILETQLYDEESGSWSTRSSFDETIYPVLTFPVAWKQPTSSDHALAGFSGWAEQYTTVYMVPAAGLQLAFTPQAAKTAGDLCVAFQVTDIQNQTHSSLPLMM